LFSNNASDRILKRNDFYIPEGTKPEDFESQEMYIETVFTFDELAGEEKNENASVPVFF